jgi:hypothetical protein
MKEVSLKDAQAVLQNIITLTKKSGKGKLEWEMLAMKLACNT